MRVPQPLHSFLLGMKLPENSLRVGPARKPATVWRLWVPRAGNFSAPGPNSWKEKGSLNESWADRKDLHHIFFSVFFGVQIKTSCFFPGVGVGVFFVVDIL